MSENHKSSGNLKLSPIEEVIEDVRLGKPVVIVDDEDRENEGDLVIAAQEASAENINFMMQEGKGLICLSLTSDVLESLAIPMQVTENSSPYGTNFAVSFDLRSLDNKAVTAEGRASTIRHAVCDSAKPEDFVRPGCVFPLSAVEGGVFQRRGQTEASVDIAKIAGLKPAGVICEIMDESGEMLCGKKLQDYCEKYNFKLTSVEALVEYRLKTETPLRKVVDCELRDLSALRIFEEGELAGVDLDILTKEPLRLVVYIDDLENREHLCIVRGEPKKDALVRIHSECLTGDVFGSGRCDCGAQFRQALSKIIQEESGVVIYLYQEGRGIGLGNKLKAYELQDTGFDTVEANLELGFAPDMRNYRAGAHILSDLGIESVRLMTNNPDKVDSLEQFGINVKERIQLVGEYNEHNIKYLMTKKTRMGHMYPGPADSKGSKS